MIYNAGDFSGSEIVELPLNTFDSNGGSITVTNLAVEDVHIHKDGGLTQRTGVSGITLSIDYEGITGNHLITIDLTDNDDAGFYSTGSNYSVRLEGITVDGQTINAFIGTFSIENRFMRGTDSAFLAASAPANFSSLSISAGGLVDVLQTAADKAWSTAVRILTAGTNLNDISAAQVNTEVDTAIADARLDELISATAGGVAPVVGSITDLQMNKNGSQTFSQASDALEAIRDRGDAAWLTGGGGALTQIINLTPVIPISIDLANTSTVRIGMMLINSVDDLPSTAEITPGTISIERKAIGGTSWSAIVTDSAMAEIAGMVYFDGVFNSGSGYVEGDSIRVTFKGISVTADANTYEIVGATGVFFQTYIRQTMRGTNSASLATGVRLSTQGKADVNAEVVDVFTVNTIPEQTQGQPPVNPTFQEATMYPYMAFRNKETGISTERAIHNDAGTKISKSTLSDDGTTFTKEKMTTGA